MCGISGWFDLAGERIPDPALMRSMNDAIAHRGPDGEGFHFAPGLAFGHRRLAIIDLKTGAQPMFDANRTLAITFNGEIYNFLELREELEGLGHRFRTRSDTEVILEAWHEWETDCVRHLSGMFAFALWDSQKGVLFLARDRMGEKPLYYSVLPDKSFIFGSELKALLRHPQLPRQIDPCAVEEFFALGYIADPRTIYKQVAKLSAGHFLLLRRGEEPKLVEYWDARPAPQNYRDLDEAANALTTRLRTAVRSQLVSDVPIGAFLSGGVDSGMTTALMADAKASPISCFTIGFNDPRFDEREYAERIAGGYGALHLVAVMGHADDELINRLPLIFDEPFGDSSALPALCLAQLARRHVTVALSGDAGDELFAGYRRYAFHLHEESLRALVPPSIREPLCGFLGRTYPQLDWAPRVLRGRQTFQELSRNTVDGYFCNVAVVDDEGRGALFSASQASDLQGYRASEVIRRHMDKSPVDDPLATAQYVDFKTWLVGDILTKVDRTAMAASLETRIPMLDHSFVEWALGLPSRFKISGQRKLVLKRAAEMFLPEDIIYRQKQGFSVPLAKWFRGSMGESFRAALARDSALADSGLFDVARLQHLIEQHQSGVRDHSRTLWLSWMFQNFLRDVHSGGVHAPTSALPVPEPAARLSA